MKLLIAVCLVALAYGATKKCYDSATSKSVDCDDKCYGPALSIAGYAGDKSGCAAECPKDYVGTCVTCETDDCNKMAELEDKNSCYTYTYDEKTKTLSAADKAKVQKCQVKKGDTATKQTCVKMVAGQTDTKYKAGGCGVCGEKETAICQQCEGDLCNGAAKITFNLVALLAIIKALF